MQCSNCGAERLKNITKAGESCACKKCGAEFIVRTSADHRPAVIYCSELPEPKRGRPATERGAYNPNPARQFGRVSDADWSEIKEACDAAELSLVAWGLPVLLAKARREKKKSVE
jgi:hypothetical protein